MRKRTPIEIITSALLQGKSIGQLDSEEMEAIETYVNEYLKRRYTTLEEKDC